MNEAGCLGDCEGLFRKLHEGMGTLAVVLSPESISVIIVPAVLLGPNPFFMNSESIMGTEMLAVRLTAVEMGLGVIICESLYLL